MEKNPNKENFNQENENIEKTPDINETEKSTEKIENTEEVKETEPFEKAEEENKESVEENKTNENLSNVVPIISKKEAKQNTKVAQKEQKLKARQEKAMRNVRWFWFFILLLLAIVLLFVWDNHQKTQYMKEQADTIRSLQNSEFFYKSKYLEKDSALSSLLKNYNTLLETNLQTNEEIDKKADELLKLQKQIFIQDSILRKLKSSLEVATSGYNRDQISVEMKNGKLYLTMRNKLLFPSGSDVVQSSGLRVLRIVADVLKKNPDIEVLIEGHTDNVPIDPKNKRFKDNWDLSTARAISVTRILTNKYKIHPERISAAGRSMYYPVAPNTTAVGRARNRRIEIIMTPNLEEVYDILQNTTTK